jgi:hypothetical protein
MSAERLIAMSDDELGAAISALDPELAWPELTVSAEAVAAAIRSGRRPTRSRSRVKTVLLAAAIVLALAAAAAAARLVIDLGAVTIESVPGRPTGIPTITAGPEDFGRPTTLAGAEAVAGFPVHVPAALGNPDRVWVDRTPAEEGPESARIVMAWAPGVYLPAIGDARWGGVLLEFRGRADVVSKHVYAQTGTIAPVSVQGTSGFWLTGIHTLDLLTDDGIRTFSVTGNVLVWQSGELTYRLETALPMAAAVRLGSSLTP